MTLRNASLDGQWLLLMRRMCHPTIAEAENNHTVGRVWHVPLCYNDVDLGCVLPPGNSNRPDAAPDSGMRGIQMRTAIVHIVIMAAG